MPTFFTRVESPVGPLLLVGTGEALTAIEFPRGDAPAAPPADAVERAAPFRAAIDQLEAYFARRLRRFELRLAPLGTGFQQAVWQALREIPYGETRSYAELAREVGRPSAVRAVGAANGRNPWPIVVPCHRVLGSDGGLTGFGGGLERKRYLLRLEGALSGALFP